MTNVTNKMLERLAQVANELFCDYEVIGIRIQEEEFQLGELDHVSHIWADGEDTGEELDGLSTIGAKDADRIYKSGWPYYGEHIAIIAGNRYTYGEDDGEVVIEDPVVIEVLA